jgi:Flp pilus assembly protein TadG
MRRIHPAQRQRDERGASAVEFALVMPFLFMLLLGMTTSGLSYSHAIGVTNAVREGSRFGATTDACGATPPAPCTGANAWATSVMQRVRDTQFDDPSPHKTKICVQLTKVTAVGATAPVVGFQCSSGGVSTLADSDLPAVPTTTSTVGTCFVQIVAARPFTINVAIQQWDKPLVRTSIARYERKDKLPTCL